MYKLMGLYGVDHFNYFLGQLELGWYGASGLNGLVCTNIKERSHISIVSVLYHSTSYTYLAREIFGI